MGTNATSQKSLGVVQGITTASFGEENGQSRLLGWHGSVLQDTRDFIAVTRSDLPRPNGPGPVKRSLR